MVLAKQTQAFRRVGSVKFKDIVKNDCDYFVGYDMASRTVKINAADTTIIQGKTIRYNLIHTGYLDLCCLFINLNKQHICNVTYLYVTRR